MVEVQWEDSDRPKHFPDPKYLQGAQLLLIGTGFAPDKVQKIYRPLFVERSAVGGLCHCRTTGRKISIGQTGGQPTNRVSSGGLIKIPNPAGPRRDLRRSERRPAQQEDAWKLLQTMLPNAKRSMAGKS